MIAKNPNNPTFNIFGPPSMQDIRVGYISTTRGYVDNLTLYEANKIAQLDPGTTFIFKTRDGVKYLNINEINALNANELIPQSLANCEGPTLNSGQGSGSNANGTTGSTTGSTTPEVVIYGAGGVGAQGNAVIGNDGSLLGIDIINHGHGYTSAPIIEVKDPSGIGAGAIIKSNLCDPKGTTYITYDEEDDYEEYDFSTGIPEDLDDYGTRYGVDGQPLGPWDPTIYANLSKDPIRAEIQEYQDYLARGLNPWWTTRNQIPLSITSSADGITKRTKWDVKHWFWGGSQSGGVKSGGVKSGGVTTGGEPLEFVEAEFLVYTEGGHGRGLMFKFTEKNGGHKFTIKADTYKDGAKAESVKIKVKPNSAYNVVSAGSHKKGRGTEQGLITAGSFGRRGKEQDDAGGGPEGNTIFADMVGTRDDDDDLQVQAKSGVFKQGKKGRSSDDKHDTFELTYILEDSSAFTPVKTTPVTITPVTITPVNTTIDDSFMNRYAISPVPPASTPGSDYGGILFTFVWEEDFPYDGEYIFRGMRDNEAKLYIDNVYIPNVTNPANSSSLTNFDAGSGVMGSGGVPAKIKQTMKAGVHIIRVDLLNIPIKEKKIIQDQETKDVTFKITTSAWFSNGISIPGLGINVQKGYKGSQLNETFTKTPEPGRLYEVICVSPETKHGIRLRTQGESTLQMEEDDDMDWQDLVCNASKGRFINIVGNTCQFVVDPPPAPQVAPAGSTVSEGIQTQNVFNTIDWIDKANRQLWRTNVWGRGGFINDYGICPFDTLHPLPDNPYAGSHRIIWNNIDFPFDGNYNIEVEVDDNVNLLFKREGDEIRIRKEGFTNKLKNEWPDNTIPGNHSTGKSTYVRAFKRGSYQLVADLEQIAGGAFSFGPGITVDGAARGNVSAKFGISGNKYYLDVTGSGSAKLDFIMEADDSWRTAGTAAKEIRINSDQGTIKLKRTPNKAKETKRGSGIFTAGKRYNVNVMGATSSAGQSRLSSNQGRPDNTLELLDSHGSDINVSLKINKISNQVADAIKGINPMALAINIQAAYTVEEVISPKSWQENPIGLAMTIDAPMPPIPQEPIEMGEGRCPRNPTWTTRFPGAKNQWWPVGGDFRWSKFMNRYALSPVPPLATLDSEMSGETFTNSWPLVIDYDGYYGLKGTKDKRGRVLIDGRVISELDGFRTENPETTKVYLSKGEYTITVEVYNERQDVYHFIDEKVFNTADWAVAQETSTITENVPGGSTSHPIIYSELNKSNKSIRVVNNNKKIELKDGKGDDANVEFEIKSGDAKFSSDGKSITGNGEVVIKLWYDDNPNYKGEAVRSITINGTVWRKQKKHHGRETHKINLGSSTIAVDRQILVGGLVSGTSRVESGGTPVTYEGPTLATYHVHALGPSLTPAWKDDDDFRRNFMGREWTSVWRGVNFPSDNQYTLQALADDGMRVYIDDVEIGNPPDFAAEVYEHIRTYNFNVPAGKHDIKITYYNIPGGAGNNFWNNPVHFSAIITVKKRVKSGRTQSWKVNPVAISAKLYPPPCPRIVEGKGTVCDPEIINPGNGYPTSSSSVGFSTYDVSINLTDIGIDDPGIGYDCTKDRIIIEPSNGAVAKPICGGNGEITGISMISIGTGYTGTPSIRIESPGEPGITTLPKGGTNAKLIPKLTIIRDPIGPDTVDPDKLIQVTDLVGLKQTGYYNGRPYYGAVFYKDGIRYAGYYETAGQLIQIYDTMQESIDARVTTPPSAIQRQGTDITSNDPTLGIPGTPDNLI